MFVLKLREQKALFDSWMKPLAERHTHTHTHYNYSLRPTSAQHVWCWHLCFYFVCLPQTQHCSHNAKNTLWIPRTPTHRQSPRILRLGIRAKFHLIHEGSKIITPREKRTRDKKKSRGWRIWEEGKTGKKGEMRRRNYILGCLQVSQVKWQCMGSMYSSIKDKSS